MFAEFIKERQYLQNVSPGTVEWYEESFKWLGNPSPSQADLKAFVVRMRQKGSVEDTGKLAAWKPNKACGSSKPRVLLKRFVPRPLIRDSLLWAEITPKPRARPGTKSASRASDWDKIRVDPDRQSFGV